jgi:tetratricopeptide (TPR) repeat protein
MSRFALPLAVFGAVLVAMAVLNGCTASPPALSAGGDIGRPSGNPLRDAQAAVRAAPANATAYASLGDAYLSRARETGDPGFYSRAERAFDAALRRDPRDVAGLIGAGTLAGLRHDFDSQLRHGLDAHRVAPALVRPFTVVADAQIELGRYPAAARTIQRLVDLKPALASYARVSYFRELGGDVNGAVAAMRLAVSAGGSPEGTAYVQTLLGDLELARGRTGAARNAYRSALRDIPSFPQALSGLARIDVASGDLKSGAARLRRATDRLPLTSALTLLAEVERAAGHRRAARANLAAARAQHALLGKNGTHPDAEAVLFEANHRSPARAVQLGRRVWQAAPSIRSADALGWAFTRAGRPSAGVLWAHRALRTGARDPLFRLHAGVAARRAGRGREAARHFAFALRGRAAWSPAAAALIPGAAR